MKAIAKVKRQRRIKNIPAYCDNRQGREAHEAQERVRKGMINIKPNRQQRRKG